MTLQDVFRTAMRAVPMPVSIVTTTHDGEDVGATIGSVTSTSMEPPLISFNVRNGSRLDVALAGRRPFGVHVLDADQAAMSQRFSSLHPAERFEGLRFERTAEGIAALEGTLVQLHCRPYARHETGDHAIVVGRVVTVKTRAGRQPLLYCDRAYRHLGRVVAPLEAERCVALPVEADRRRAVREESA